MSAVTTRHPKARESARAFIDSVLVAPGVEVAFGDLASRAVKAGVPSSGTVLNSVLCAMAEEGLLDRPRKGIYCRKDPRGVALDLPSPSPDPSAHQADLSVPQLAGIMTRLERIESVVLALDEHIRGLLTSLGS